MYDYIMDSFKQKYLKYKTKYEHLKKLKSIYNNDSLKTLVGGSLHQMNEDVLKELDEKDTILLKKLEEFVKENCSEEYPLATGMLHISGIIQYGLACKSPLGYDVHGEHTVISQARIFDKNKKNYLSLVCISAKNKIKAPCGICREVLRYHYPELHIIVPHPNTGKLVKIMAKYLLPYPYVSTQLPDASKLDDNIEVKYIQKKKRSNRKK